MRTNNPTLCSLWIRLMLFVFIAGLSRPAFSQHSSRPQWLSKGEAYLNGHRTNQTYYFKIIQNVGADLAVLRQGNTNALADYIGKRNKVQGLEIMEIDNRQTQGGGVRTRENYQMAFKNEFSTEVFYATLVDEWWEMKDGYYSYYALFAVSSSGSQKPVLDRFEVSRSYGAAPAVMSIIPGVGQLYKGQKIKGGLMLAGAAVGTAAIIYTANRRSYYETRIIEQPKFARDYSKKRDNFTTYRNIAIGATGALVVWSILDAALTPGATRIRVSPSTSWAFSPTAIPNADGVGFGASLAINF